MHDLPDTQLQSFTDMYRNSVVLPAVKGRPLLLCPIGLVGSGKTTVLKPLAEKLGLVRISHDDIRKLLKEHEFNYLKSEEIALAVAKAFLKKGYGVAIDADCVRPEKRKQLEQMSENMHMPLRWIHINPPEDFILNKLRTYPHTWLFKDAEDALKNYRARKPLHKNLNFRFAFVFDPSRPDLDQQIEKAATIINKP